MKKSLLKNIHFGRVVVWCGVIRMIIHIFKASIPPSSRYYIHPSLQISEVQNSLCGKELNHFLLPKRSDDLCLLFYIYPCCMTVHCTGRGRKCARRGVTPWSWTDRRRTAAWTLRETLYSTSSSSASEFSTSTMS